MSVRYREAIKHLLLYMSLENGKWGIEISNFYRSGVLAKEPAERMTRPPM